MYDATLGRFLSRDPIGPAPGAGNDYVYADDSPAARTDPFGLAPEGMRYIRTYYQTVQLLRRDYRWVNVGERTVRRPNNCRCTEIRWQLQSRSRTLERAIDVYQRSLSGAEVDEINQILRRVIGYIDQLASFNEAQAAEQERMAGIAGQYTNWTSGSGFVSWNRSALATPLRLASAALGYLRNQAQENAISWQNQVINLLRFKDQIRVAQLSLANPNPYMNYDTTRLLQSLGIGLSRSDIVEVPGELVIDDGRWHPVRGGPQGLGVFRYTIVCPGQTATAPPTPEPVVNPYPVR